MTSPVSGFRFSAVSAGLRQDGRVDVALAAADAPAVCAGVFTRNLVRAAPVDVATERVRAGHVRAVLANSGTANACTGQAGFDAVLASTEAVARALGVPSSSVLPASTGVIGKLLDAQRVAVRAGELVKQLSAGGFSDFAQAICTTDRWEKIAEARAGSARVLGIGKGAGMIHPDLGTASSTIPPHATMLAFLFTDAAVARPMLSRALVAAVDTTFNACSVDGDTSTNDTVLALASGAAGPCDADALARAFSDVCSELARSMVADGEGATHAVEIRVSGLASDAEARIVARAIATSMLVKTALFGQDANWGRLLAAAGRAGVAFDPAHAAVSIAGVEVVRDGVTLGAPAEAEAAHRMTEPSYAIDIVLGSGSGHFSYLTSDLGHGYVDINAGYRS